MLNLRYLDSGQSSQEFLPLTSSSAAARGAPWWLTAPVPTGASGLQGYHLKGPVLSGALPSGGFSTAAGTTLKQLLWGLLGRSLGSPLWLTGKRDSRLKECLHFHNTFPSWMPGKAMSITFSQSIHQSCESSKSCTMCSSFCHLTASAQGAGSCLAPQGRWRPLHPMHGRQQGPPHHCRNHESGFPGMESSYK